MDNGGLGLIGPSTIDIRQEVWGVEPLVVWVVSKIPLRVFFLVFTLEATDCGWLYFEHCISFSIMKFSPSLPVVFPTKGFPRKSVCSFIFVCDLFILCSPFFIFVCVLIVTIRMWSNYLYSLHECLY